MRDTKKILSLLLVPLEVISKINHFFLCLFKNDSINASRSALVLSFNQTWISNNIITSIQRLCLYSCIKVIFCFYPNFRSRCRTKLACFNPYKHFKSIDFNFNHYTYSFPTNSLASSNCFSVISMYRWVVVKCLCLTSFIMALMLMALFERTVI